MFKSFKYILVLLILFKTASCHEKILEVGEELNYKVYYGFIKLGEVSFRISGTYTENKKTYYNAIARIKSYEGVPFVNINYIFETRFEHIDDEIFSARFFSSEFKSKSITNIEYLFNYPDNLINIKKDIDNKSLKDTSVYLSELTKLQDGLSLFYNARLKSFSNKNYKVPVFINEKQSSLRYSFNMNRDVISDDIADYDISVIKVAGVADFVGVFGLTGEFIGWFSDDDARVPVKYQFNVTIGSISLELVSYKKKNWKPPVYTG